MTSTPLQISAALSRRKALADIQRRHDPASGVTVTIRRGCNDPDEEGESERNPTVELQVSTNVDVLLALLTEENERLLQFWAKSARDEIRELEATLALHGLPPK